MINFKKIKNRHLHNNPSIVNIVEQEFQDYRIYSAIKTLKYVVNTKIIFKQTILMWKMKKHLKILNNLENNLNNLKLIKKIELTK